MDIYVLTFSAELIISVDDITGTELRAKENLPF